MMRLTGKRETSFIPGAEAENKTARGRKKRKVARSTTREDEEMGWKG